MTKPNFIFIMADDLGYADLGCYGGRGLHGRSISPNLDRLAAQGMLFTQGYSNAPVCSPTRFALITGSYQYRIRGALDEPMAGKARGSLELGLPPDQPTMPSVLRAHGYKTSLVGKWHLGYPPHFGPLKSGYDEHFGPTGGGVDYFTHKERSGIHDLHENGVQVHREGYLTDLLSDRACQVVRQRAADHAPFLMSLHYTAPHWPWETRDDRAVAESLDNIGHLDGGNVETYLKMIEQMDEGIGKLLETLDSTGLASNTMIVFTSDNGGERFSDNWPLVGGKMDLTEGGIRVPYIVRWPGQVAAGRVSATPLLTMDWMPTFLEAAGVPVGAQPAMDGQSLLAYLKGTTNVPSRALNWRMKHRAQRARREGQWKYLKVDDHEYLFDVMTDARERANLGNRYPERLSSMRADWEQWQKGMPEIPLSAAVSLIYTEKDMPQR